MRSLSRRSFVKTVGAGSVGAFALPLIAARGHEAAHAAGSEDLEPFVSEVVGSLRARVPAALRLDSNENPNGPGAAALDAIRGMFGEAPRYPDPSGLRAAIAKQNGVAVENVVLGCGSGEILRMASYAFTSPARPLVTAAPTFEDPTRYSTLVGAPVRAVPVRKDLTLDLEGMAGQCVDAGLVFLCNPNNPTGTVLGRRAVQNFVARVKRASPDTAILIDEAYHEYVEDPAYATSISLAMENPRVVVARTFSKIYGMAGLRVGYAVGHASAIRKLQREKLSVGVNVLATAAALAVLGDPGHAERERRLNRQARDYTRRFFEGAGFRVYPSQTNFLMVDVRRDSRAFQDACSKLNVLVGRPFPPLTTMARISIGTMDEMRQAADVFTRVLV